MNYQYQSIQSTCPACKSNFGDFLWEIDSQSAALHFVTPAENGERYKLLVSHLNVLWKQKNCRVIQCKSCHFSYSSPYVPGDKYFYDLAYIRTGYPKWKWEFEKALSWIKESKKNYPRILEIGAGEGAFLKELAEGITNPNNLVAIEYSDYGRDKIESLNIKCFSEDIRSISPEQLGHKFDFICLFQVLEHMGDLDELMDRLRNLLSKDGEIIFAVPNEELIKFNELNGALLDMPPNHIGRWTKEAFQSLSSKHGLTLKSLEKENCRIAPGIKLLLTYRSLRRSQTSGTIDHFVRYKINKKISRFAIYGIYLIDFFVGLPIIGKFCLNSKKLGDSQIARVSIAHSENIGGPQSYS